MAYEPERSDVPLEESRSGTDVRLIVRLVVAAAAVVLGVLFIVQNSERVETSFVFFDVTTRLWVSLLVAFALGAFLGQAITAMRARRKRKKAA